MSDDKTTKKGKRDMSNMKKDGHYFYANGKRKTELIMGMDIYFSTDKNNLVATIDSLSSIEKPLVEFKKKTGVVIDEYGKTNLYFDHIKLLNELINQQNEWKTVFQNAIDKKSGLIIEGD